MINLRLRTKRLAFLRIKTTLEQAQYAEAKKRDAFENACLELPLLLRAHGLHAALSWWRTVGDDEQRNVERAFVADLNTLHPGVGVPDLADYLMRSQYAAELAEAYKRCVAASSAHRKLIMPPANGNVANQGAAHV